MLDFRDLLRGNACSYAIWCISGIDHAFKITSNDLSAKNFLHNLALLALSFQIKDLLHVLYSYVCDIVFGIYFVGKMFE